MSEKKVDGSGKKPVMQMPKSIKRILALMDPAASKAYKPIMWDAVKTYNFQHQQMLRRKSGDKDSAGD
jgi:hypothetical protein